MYEESNKRNKVEEHYFDEYYRVIVISEEGKYIVSVDVYRVGWSYKNYKEICIENICLLLKELPINLVGTTLRGVEKVILVGTRVGDKYETINVKWIVDHKPSDVELQELYDFSWKLIRISENT